jgi:osmotically-inducible protein OsmY
MKGKRLMIGMGIGAIAAYYADRDRGHARRTRDADRARATLRRRRREAASHARYEAGRAEGEAAIRAGAGRFHPADDRAVVEHLRAVLNGLDVDTNDVNVEVVDGVVRLRGQVPDSEASLRVISTVSGEPGVRFVESFLHLPGQPAPNKVAALRATQPSGVRATS